MLEALASCLTYYPVTFNDQMGRPMRRSASSPPPASVRRATGWSGSGSGPGSSGSTSAPWSEHPEWTEDPKLFLDRTALASDDRRVDRPAHASTRCSTWPRPSASPTHRSSTARTSRPSSTSAVAGPSPRTRGTVRRTRARLTGSARASLRPPEPAPRLGAAHHRRRPCSGATAQPAWPRPQRSGALPFEGLRVLDMTAFWAGPLAGHVLALLGAEVIHLESSNRPDGVRLVGGVPQSEDAVLGTRTDLRRAQHQQEEPDARPPRPARQRICSAEFVTTCDVVIENYTPAGARPARRRLRDAAERTSGSGHGPDAGVRARWAVARPGGVRLRDRGRIGAHLADRPPGPAPVRAVHRRRPQRRAARASSACSLALQHRRDGRGRDGRGGDGRRRASTSPRSK